MKKIAFMLLASATIFLASCGGNTEATDNATATDSTAVCCDTTVAGAVDTTSTVVADTTKK